MTYYRRRDMTDAEWALAGALAVAVGAATFYLTRIWLQRETISEGPPRVTEPEAALEASGSEAELGTGVAKPEPEEAEPDVVSETEGAERRPR